MLTPADLQQLTAHGVDPHEAARQLALLAQPPPPVRLLRPCTAGDGVLRLDARGQAEAEAAGTALLQAARVAKFVPASGAASRMFKDLLAALEGKEAAPPAPVAKLLAEADRFAFAGAWRQALGGLPIAQAPWREALRALLHAPGLDLARKPKALIDFHRVGGAPHTALEDQVREAAALGLGALHLTVSPEHEEGFAALVRALAGRAPGVAISHSFQSPSTDTLAGDGAGGVYRDQGGRLVLRPGGHGALIENLGRLAAAADVALVKNIDNVAHPRLWPEQLRWKRILAGVLAQELARGWDRPVRVAGVVRNTGEPGGGPFWVAGEAEPQIVESAQMDLSDPAQKALSQAATHFNPVDLACRLTDAGGRPFDLGAFVDPSAVFLSHKSHQGKPLVALERPGLWNGAMARWRTVFVEVPLETFNPVKTVADLLRPAHQEA